MPNKILVAYATRYGSTQEVARTVAATLGEAGLEVDLQTIRNVHSLDAYQGVVLGAPIYIGKWHEDARRFVKHFRKALTQRAVAVFALGPVSTDENEMLGSRAQFNKQLMQYPWLMVVAQEMFVGRYAPDRLSPVHHLLSALPASPLHDLPAADNRDWAAIRTWAGSLPPKLMPAQPA